MLTPLDVCASFFFIIQKEGGGGCQGSNGVFDFIFCSGGGRGRDLHTRLDFTGPLTGDHN